MNKIVKAILVAVAKGAEDTVAGMIPGAGALISGVHKLVDKTHDNNVEAIDELETGLITVVQSLGPDKVADATLVMMGLNEIRAGFSKVKDGLKK